MKPALRAAVREAGYVALACLPILAILSPILLFDRSLAFRDTAVFYHPMYEWIDSQAALGQTTWWNPHINYGLPVAGEGSSSLFYPGRIIFALPGEFARRFKIYIASHFLLAAASAYGVLRRRGSSPAAACFAAYMFSCGGAFLFQYCNLVFLVGAAWLPLAFACVEAMAERLSLRAAIGLGIVLALMTLGGDPQCAYHVGLAATAYVFACHLHFEMPMSLSARLRAGVVPFLLLATAAITGGCAAAVQVLPSQEASRHSERAAYHVPRSAYEAIETLRTKKDGGYRVSQGLFRDPESMTHGEYIYNFSFAPWHVIEYIVPNFGGDIFPRFRRWIGIFPYEPRIWSISVYAGLLPIFAAVAALRFRRGDMRNRWLSWIALIAMLGSCGIYGVGWFIRGIAAAVGPAEWQNHLPGSQVGGVYWFFVVFLPGYAYFRFPAKLLTFAAWPLALLAAERFDRLRCERALRLPRALCIAACLATCAAIALLLLGSWWHEATKHIEPAETFGPFDIEGARFALICNLFHTAIVATIGWRVLRSGPLSDRAAWSLAALTAMEIVIANHGLILTAPTEVWRTPPMLAELVEPGARVRPSQGDPGTSKESEEATKKKPFRASGDEPVNWETTSSSTRGDDYALAERHLAATNHALAAGIHWVDALASVKQADYVYWQEWHQRNEEAYWGAYWLSARSVSFTHMSQWEEVKSERFTQLTQCRLFRHKEPFPRAWLVHRVLQLPELHSLDPHELKARGKAVVQEGAGKAPVRRDFRKVAVIEFDGLLSPEPSEPTADAEESCRLVSVENDRLKLTVELASPGLLVLGDLYYPGWEAWDVTRAERVRLPIVRTNRIYRGVPLAAGRHEIEFRYVPHAVNRGRTISLITWSLLALLGIGDLVRTRRSKAIVSA